MELTDLLLIHNPELLQTNWWYNTVQYQMLTLKLIMNAFVISDL